MEDLATFSARKVNRAAAEEREKDKYHSKEAQSELKKKQSHPDEPFEN